MRTTVNIDDRLLKQAKVAATRSGRSLSDIVDDGLRLLLTRAAPAGRQPAALPTYGGSGLRPGVDLEDKAALLELLDEG
ncbi:MAG: hypothetical protein QOG99_1755 [Frankiales bacterium]|nr:hypothetical protein [Frankiales bacterium]